MKNCPRCASELTKYSKVCPRCGLPVSQMDEFVKRFNLQSEDASTETSEEQTAQTEKINKSDKKALKQQKKQAKKAEKQAKKERESKSDTDFKKFASNSGEGAEDYLYDENDTFSDRKRKRKNRLSRPVFDLDEKGEIDIDTADVEIVGKETGKIIDERFEQSYSVKKSRGDYRPPKIKWWEIYKLSDRYFARRKIKKEVSKAARIKPSFISKSKLLILAIFFGYTGAHNFYAKNKRKGFVSLITLLIWVSIPLLAKYVAFFKAIEISVAGLAGLIDLVIWITDVVNIIFNKFKYRLQIDKFISEMNVETRAKLGEKYIDLDLYFKPWWVRLKAWFDRKKRNYQEYKRDRRQANIDRQKRKLEAEREKNKIDREIYDFEQKEEERLNREKSSNVAAPAETETETAKEQTPAEADIQAEESKTEVTTPKKKTGVVVQKKYTKTIKKKTSSKKKK